MGETTGPQLLLVAYNALSAGERREAYELIRTARLDELAAGESELARAVRSLRLAAARAGTARELTVEEYRATSRQLRGSADAILPLSRVLRVFEGSWRAAKEAIDLAEVETPASLEARLRRRKVGKVWRYRDETLVATLNECCADYGGRAVQVAEFEWWRDERIRLTRAQGDDAFHLPSPTAYRRRWRTWEGALIACCGYTRAEVAGRLEARAGRGETRPAAPIRERPRRRRDRDTAIRAADRGGKPTPAGEGKPGPAGGGPASRGAARVDRRRP